MKYRIVRDGLTCYGEQLHTEYPFTEPTWLYVSNTVAFTKWGAIRLLKRQLYPNVLQEFEIE